MEGEFEMALAYLLFGSLVLALSATAGLAVAELDLPAAHKKVEMAIVGLLFVNSINRASV